MIVAVTPNSRFVPPCGFFLVFLGKIEGESAFMVLSHSVTAVVATTQIKRNCSININDDRSKVEPAAKQEDKNYK